MTEFNTDNNDSSQFKQLRRAHRGRTKPIQNTVNPWIKWLVVFLAILSAIGTYYIIKDLMKSPEQRMMEEIMGSDVFRRMQQENVELLNSPEFQELQRKQMEMMNSPEVQKLLEKQMEIMEQSIRRQE